MNLHFASRHPRLVLGLGLGVCALAATVALVFAGKRKPDDVFVLRRNFETVLVQQGDLVVPVPASGIFVEKEKKLLASPTSGTVEEIPFAPGAMVKKGDVVFRLSNSRLAEQAQASRVALETGFYDQSHLHRHFKRLCGMTPCQYSGQAGARGQASERAP